MFLDKRIILDKHQQDGLCIVKGVVLMKKHKDRSMRVYHSRDGKSSQIILQGRWLCDAGFAPGDFLSVSVRDNKIVINIKEKFETV